MTRLIIVIFTIFSMSAMAHDFKVMSFNTMCDFCGKKGFDEFDKRKQSIKKIIQNSQAQLISLQEVRSEDQLNYFFQDSPQYKLLFWKGFFVSYPDPTLAINTDRFAILENGHFWLGPNKGAFSIGWKYALPRQVQWAKLRDKLTEQKFYFLGSHFDNRVENMLGSAQMVQDFIQDKKIPIIFAADTNCTSDFEGYQKLVGKNFINSFDLHKESRNIANAQDGKALCYLRKGKHFPACRVDHILFTGNSPWKVKNWFIDTYKGGELINYPSDHRPVTATFTY